MKEQKRGKCKIPNSKNKMQSSGVTLIALIITIIILLILAMTSVALVMRWNIIEKTEMAAEGYQSASERDILGLAYSEYAMDSVNNEDADLTVEDADVNGSKNVGWNVQFKKSGNKYTVDSDGNIREQAVQVTVGEDTVTLTEENVADYLGKVVTNFKTDSSGTETITVGTEETGGTQEVTVSKTYRLYWIDFDNKYGGGAGTIYLKADCTNNGYILPITDTTESTKPNIKIRNLNPELYKENVTPQNENNNNMKAVTWLLNTTNWEGLKEGVNEKIKSKIYFIVGAPSLEMMIDSYNTHYGLKGETPDCTQIQEEERRKFFYQYNSGESGYKVAPGKSANYDTVSLYNSLRTDPEIDTVYFPGDNLKYWLSSPSAYNSNTVAWASGNNDCLGFDTYNYGGGGAFCPLVCLDDSVLLELEK